MQSVCEYNPLTIFKWSFNACISSSSRCGSSNGFRCHHSLDSSSSDSHAGVHRSTTLPSLRSCRSAYSSCRHYPGCLCRQSSLRKDESILFYWFILWKSSLPNTYMGGQRRSSELQCRLHKAPDKPRPKWISYWCSVNLINWF